MRTKNKTKIHFNTKTIKTIPVEKIIAVTKQQPKEAVQLAIKTTFIK